VRFVTIDGDCRHSAAWGHHAKHVFISHGLDAISLVVFPL
jgi:hypothetical protein